MSIYDIIPVENNGMSVISLMTFFFVGVIFTLVFRWIVSRFAEQNERFKEHDERFKEHDDCVEELRNGLSDGRVQFAELKGLIKNTENIVSRIERAVSDMIKK